jgi:predicted nucleic acid-binding Zn ribbon protein
MISSIYWEQVRRNFGPCRKLSKKNHPTGTDSLSVPAAAEWLSLIFLCSRSSSRFSHTIPLSTILLPAGDEHTWTMSEYEWDSVKFTAAAATAKSGLKAAAEDRAPKAEAEALAGARVAQAPSAGPVQCSCAATMAGSDSSGANVTGSDSGGGPSGAPRQASKHLASRPFVCQADGCGKPLDGLTHYHVRNRICDVHIRADIFHRDGQPLRFCQRCGRAHDPAEFDPNKHSCRQQLEKHNARRRAVSIVLSFFLFCVLLFSLHAAVNAFLARHILPGN